MKKPTATNKRALKWVVVALIVSVFFNIILLGSVLVARTAFNGSDMALHDWSRQQLCDTNYDEHVADMNEEQEKVFAALTCGYNYKTGADLDFQPVLDQIK